MWTHTHTSDPSDRSSKRTIFAAECVSTSELVAAMVAVKRKANVAQLVPTRLDTSQKGLDKEDLENKKRQIRVENNQYVQFFESFFVGGGRLFALLPPGTCVHRRG